MTQQNQEPTPCKLLALALGWSDLFGSYVVDQHAGDLWVGYHEAIHIRMALETSYGSAQRVFSGLCRDSTLSTEVRQVATSWDALLFQKSEHAHEVVATYLAVKQCDSHEHPELISRLSNYRRYFEVLADVLDHTFRSSYMQYLVGRTLGIHCFQSTLLERLASTWSLLGIPRVEAIETPNYRLAHFVSRFDQSRRSSLLNELRASIEPLERRNDVPSGFDVQDETHWIRLGEAANPVNEILAITCSNWFEEHIPLSETMPQDHNTSALLTLLQRVITETGSRAFIVWDPRSPRVLQAGDLPTDGSERSVIANTTVAAKDSISWEESAPFLVKATERVCVSMPNWFLGNDDDVWYVINFWEDHTRTVYGMSHVALKQCLQLREQRILTRGRYHDYDAYVVRLAMPLTSDDRLAFSRGIEAAIEMLSIKMPTEAMSGRDPDWIDEVSHPGIERLVWYMAGDVYWWVEWLAKRAQVSYLAVPFAVQEPGAKRGDPSRGFLGMHGFYTPSFPGVFLRFMSGSPFAVTHRVIQTLVKRDVFKEEVGENAKRVWNLGRMTFGAIGAVWPEF